MGLSLQKTCECGAMAQLGEEEHLQVWTGHHADLDVVAIGFRV